MSSEITCLIIICNLQENQRVCRKHNNHEINFVVKTPETRKYYQICKTIGDTENLCKKCESLELIKDNYEKIVLTLDKDVKKEWKGIKFINIIDFLLEEY